MTKTLRRRSIIKRKDIVEHLIIRRKLARLRSTPPTRRLNDKSLRKSNLWQMNPAIFRRRILRRSRDTDLRSPKASPFPSTATTRGTC